MAFRSSWRASSTLKSSLGRQALPQQFTRLRQSSSLSHLHSNLTSRHLPLLLDFPTPVPSYLLTQTLADFLPRSKISGPPILSSIVSKPHLPPSHHLIYFPPPTPLSSLLPDGTDPDQSPGDPFVRRMWAGGRIDFRVDKSEPFKLDGEPAACLERITDVSVKGAAGDEKVFVAIERRIGQSLAISNGKETREDQIRGFLLTDDNCTTIEQRNIVFMRERSRQVAADAAKASGKVVKPPHEPTISHTLTPTAALLFRFSALTFNVHRIHLEKQFCRETEGHRNLLVHGPLSLVLMVELLQRHLESRYVEGQVGKRIAEIEYRNLAPVYAEEPMRVCARERGNGEWDVWVEGRDGGYAVKGFARTVSVSR
ncbi:hypothetical protein MMC20_006729 [Loxospora ochrophaea]|nr:hypothetical protein [Loxospora ochrophaea]